MAGDTGWQAPGAAPRYGGSSTEATSQRGPGPGESIERAIRGIFGGIFGG